MLFVDIDTAGQNYRLQTVIRPL